MEPCLGQAEFPSDDLDFDAECFGGFGGGEASEVVHLDEAGLAGGAFFEGLEGFVEFEYDGRPGKGGVARLVDVQFGCAPAALEGIVRAGVIDEDLAHELGGDAEKVGAIAIVGLILADHARVDLVDEGGGLECMAGAFATKLAVGEAAQLIVNEGDQLVERGLLTVGELVQETRDGMRIGRQWGEYTKRAMGEPREDAPGEREDDRQTPGAGERQRFGYQRARSGGRVPGWMVRLSRVSC